MKLLNAKVSLLIGFFILFYDDTAILRAKCSIQRNFYILTQFLCILKVIFHIKLEKKFKIENILMLKEGILYFIHHILPSFLTIN